MAFALAFVLACSGDRDDVVSSRRGIERDGSGKIFNLVTTLTAQRSRAARERETASRATGALLVPMVDGSGALLRAANGTSIRGSCGATFIAPSYAITAAHCVDGTLAFLDALEVEMYRPTPDLDGAAARPAPLTGAFPGFEHPRLGAADGYLVDRYPCLLVSRCSESYGGPVNCDAANAADGDIALVRCNGTPGAKYGFLAIASSDDAGAEVFMPWKHEVYDLPPDLAQNLSDDRWQHYVAFSGDYAANYHYMGVDGAALEQNQLLPLVSPDFPDGTPHRKLSATALEVSTDLFGCHGTSGSGVLQPGGQGSHRRWELLGPIATGNPEQEQYLCNHAPSLDGFCRDPGCLGISYRALSATKAIIARNARDVAADCDPLGPGGVSLFLYLDCWVRHLAADASNAAFAARLAAPTSASSLDVLRDPVVVIATAETVSLTAFATEAGQDYRLEVAAHPTLGCVVAPCPRLSVKVDGREIVARSFDAPTTRPVLLSGSFRASATKTVTVAIVATGDDRIEVGGLTLRPEGRPQRFDTLGERLEAVLVDLDTAGEEPQPMRFVGDGKAGFAARLLGNERMVLTRQALPPGRRWTARFGASPPATLTCGLLDAAGAVARTTDCSSGFAALDDSSSTSPRAGFFISTAAQTVAVTIDDVQLASDASPDTDGDSIPDALDPCPRGPLPATGELNVTFPESPTFPVCLPEPGTFAVPLPVVHNACEAPTLSGRLSAVNGRTLDPLVVNVSGEDGRVLLPLGAHTITWEVRDRAGHVYATVGETVEVVLSDGSACCPAGQTCPPAGAGDDVVLDGIRLSGGAGDDYLRAGAGDAVLLGGDGADYLGGGRGGTLAVYAGLGDDTVHARFASSARLYGGGGADVIVGSEGADEITPGPGAAFVLAGGGDDTLTIHDVCELGPGMRLDGGDGIDTLVSPVALEALLYLGIQIDRIENVAVDTTHTYLAECF